MLATASRRGSICKRNTTRPQTKKNFVISMNVAGICSNHECLLPIGEHGRDAWSQGVQTISKAEAHFYEIPQRTAGFVRHTKARQSVAASVRPTALSTQDAQPKQSRPVDRGSPDEDKTRTYTHTSRPPRRGRLSEEKDVHTSYVCVWNRKSRGFHNPNPNRRPPRS